MRGFHDLNAHFSGAFCRKTICHRKLEGLNIYMQSPKSAKLHTVRNK